MRDASVLNLSRHPAALSLFALVAFSALAQPGTQTVAPHAAPVSTQAAPVAPKIAPIQAPAPIPLNRLTIVLDAAHGGVDSGSRIGDSIHEKDVTLAFAFKLRSLLAARGFAVVLTRDADAPAQPSANGSALTLDDRAGIANHAHPAACLLLHATGTGTGVHLYNSELEPTDGVPQYVPWLLAQAAWVPQSRLLGQQLAAAFTRAAIPLVKSAASVRPVDSLACPALVVELAPQTDEPDTINYADYQQHIAETIAGSLVFWRDQVQPPNRIAPPVPASGGGQP